ncbi:MAG: SMI1/KNR4 family protein [Nocardiopsaceae bacterium]|nr:SMI1/KNR4 family protein [Nocardiopsaceae bacterium]
MATPSEVEDCWARVTAWLAVNAPVSYAALRPPAVAADARLPAELRRLLLVNDGADLHDPNAATFLPGQYFPLPAGRIADNCAVNAEVLADIGDAGMAGHWWHPRWFMFAEDGLGNGLVIDDRPGPGQGMVWEWSKYDGLIGEPAPSLGGFLADVARVLEGGTVLRGWRPVAMYGFLRWTVPGGSHVGSTPMAPVFRVDQVEPHDAGSLAVTGCGTGAIRPGLLFDSAVPSRDGCRDPSGLVQCRLRVTEVRIYGHLADETGDAIPSRLVLSGQAPDCLAPGAMLAARSPDGIR